MLLATVGELQYNTASRRHYQMGWLNMQSFSNYISLGFFKSRTATVHSAETVTPRIYPEPPKDAGQGTPGSITSNESGSDSDISTQDISTPKIMKAVEAFKLMADYFIFLDEVPASTKRDEEVYQHNKKIILDIIKLGRNVINLPKKGDAVAFAQYLKKIEKYYEAINKKQMEFSSGKSYDLERMRPKIRGDKSKIFAYFYLDCLRCKSSGNAKVDAHIQYKIRRVDRMIESLAPKIELSENARAVIDNIDTAVILRRNRRFAIHSDEPLEIELAVAGMPNEEKNALLSQALKNLAHYRDRIKEVMLDNPQKYPIQTEAPVHAAMVERNFHEDLLYKYTEKDYLLIVRYPDKELLRNLRDAIDNTALENANNAAAALTNHDNEGDASDKLENKIKGDDDQEYDEEFERMLNEDTSSSEDSESENDESEEEESEEEESEDDDVSTASFRAS